MLISYICVISVPLKPLSNENLEYKVGRSEIIIILLFSLIKLIIHLYTNAFASYGIFRDEFYYLACASRPDIGYVDQQGFFSAAKQLAMALYY